MNTPQTAFQRATSRKLLIALGTLASVLTGVELTDRQALVVVVIAVAYIFAEAAVDWQRARTGFAPEAATGTLIETPATAAVTQPAPAASEPSSEPVDLNPPRLTVAPETTKQ